MTNQRNAKSWGRYLARFSNSKKSLYSYPTDESRTDGMEAQQDPFKRTREMEAIRCSVPKGAGVVVDLGCGVGRNFETLRKATKPDTLYIGIEPDIHRAALAEEASRDFHVLNSGIEFIDQAPSSLLVDYLLCCQVLGHTTVAAMEHMVGVILARVSENGVVNFCIPFINKAMANSNGDYYHLVDLSKSPDEDGFRIGVSKERFERCVTKNVKSSFLPVRAFCVPIPTYETMPETPFDLDALPDSFLGLISDSFNARATVYSVHTWKGQVPYVGDISITVERKAE